MFILEAWVAVITALVFVLGVVLCAWLFVVLILAPIAIVAALQERNQGRGKG